MFYLKSEFGETGRDIFVILPDVRYPITMGRRTAEAWMFGTVFVNKDYDFDVGVEPATIIDLGAHIGMASIYFANRYPNARILAIEPSSRNFARLQQNTRHYDNITPVHAAIWSHAGWVTLANPDDHSSAYQVRLLHSNERGDAEIIRAMTMDEVLSVAGFDRVDVLEIDVEGAELPLFSANTDWLRNVRVVAVELHDRFVPGCKEAVQAGFAAQGLSWRSEQIVETTVYRLSASGPIVLDQTVPSLTRAIW
jgi:FkbM family methyltransferase